MLRIEGLTKYYGRTLGVKNVDLAVAPGEIFGFIGPNGAGKSTTIRCAMDLIRRTAGEVYVDGKPFSRKTSGQKALVGYLPSEINLYGDMRVRELISYAGSFYGHIDNKRLGLLIRRLELDLSKKIDQLSLGNRKKLGIVLALQHSPKLLILDEATSGLDPLMQEAFYDILREERDRGAAIFFSSHNLTEVRRLCSRVAIIRQGEIRMTDTIENIVNGFMHQVTLECGDPAIAQRLGGEAIEREGRLVRFLYEGDPDALIAELSKTKVDRLLIEEPSLEDVFLHYYQ